MGDIYTVYHKFYGSGDVYRSTPLGDAGEVAVLDTDSLVCTWVPYEKRDYFAKRLMDNLDFYSAKAKFKIYGSKMLKLWLEDKLFILTFKYKSLLLFEDCIVPAVPFMEDFWVALLCQSIEGVYRLCFYLNKIGSTYLNIWLDVEERKALAYAWNFDCSGGIYQIAGSDDRKYKELLGKLAMSMLLHGRLF